MRALMALVACLEFAQHCFAVRCIMTTLTFRYHGMLVGMAEDALEFCVLGRAGFQGVPDVRVTGCTVAVNNRLVVGKCERLMGLVALNTVFKFLAFSMCIMAIQAVRLISVLFVAERTGKTCMRSRV